MGGLGLGELVVILLIVLVIFGAGRLPQVGDALGKAIKNFKRSSNGEDALDVTPPRQGSLPEGRSADAAPRDAETRKA